MKKARVKVLRDEEQKIERDLVLKKGKMYVLKDKELKTEIIQLYHNMLVVGYRGRQKTTKLVIRNYWWLGVTKNVGRYMERYNLCQRIKNRTEAPAGKLMINEVPEKV